MTVHRRKQHRRGNILVLSAFLMVGAFGLLALAVDTGYLYVVSSQLQKSADATALAAAWDLIDEGKLSGDSDPETVIAEARARADQYAALNTVAGQSPVLSSDDVQIGQLVNPTNPDDVMIFTDPTRFNAIRTRVRWTSEQNGPVSLFFARVLGIDSADAQAEATAVFLDNLNGFGKPSDGSNLNILPFALDETTWNLLLVEQENPSTPLPYGISNTHGWADAAGGFTADPDGILEANLFPQGTGSPGNRGTVDIGAANNSTADLARQILHGITPADLDYIGGSLEFDANGELFLNGDTGISAGMKEELASIIGETRCIPIFSNVTGNGNNATYTIVKFVGVRILEVKLTGKMSGKKVIIQPADVQCLGMIPGTGPPKADFIYSPVWLAR